VDHCQACTKLALQRSGQEAIVATVGGILNDAGKGLTKIFGGLKKALDGFDERLTKKPEKKEEKAEPGSPRPGGRGR
jgi:hypothetical protein